MCGGPPPPVSGRRSGPRSRKAEGEGTSAARPAGAPDMTAVGFDYSLGDGESEPDSALVVLPRLPELLEQVHRLLGCDAWTRVDDFEDHLAIPRLGAQSNLAPLRRKLERVAQQIAER